MRTFFETAALTILLGTVATLTGRLLTAALGLRLLRRPTPESFLVSGFIGTGFLALAYGWGSYAGLPARWCLLLVGVLLAALVIGAAVRGRLREVVVPARPRLAGVAVLLCVSLPLLSYFLPLAIGRTYLTYSDASAYLATAEWLQFHGFGTEVVVNPHHPVDTVVHRFQDLSHRMGPIHLLALFRAAVPTHITAELFPAVVGWGLVLNMAGVYVVCRWAMRLSRFWAAGGALLVGTAYSSLCLSANYGFLCQIHGTASLAFALAVLSRLMSRVNWRWDVSLLAGLVFSTLVSMYSELSPVAAFATLCCIGWTAWRARRLKRLGRLARFVGLTVLALAVVGNYEWLRAVVGVTKMSQIPRVGMHIPWDDQDYILFASGFSPFSIFSFDALAETPHLIGVGVAAAAFLAGLACLLRRRRTLPLSAALFVLAALAAYFRYRVLDPWTGQLGQTWNLLKIVKWSFPIVAAVQIAGLALLLRRVPGRRLVLLTLCCLGVWIAAPVHWEQSRDIIERIRNLAGPRSGLRDLKELCHLIDARQPRNLYFACGQPGPWPRAAAGYLLYPRPFVSGWRGAKFFQSRWLLKDHPEDVGPDTLFFQQGEPPFGRPVEVLPLNYSLIDGTRPQILNVDNPNGCERWDGEGATWVGDKPCRLHVFAPRAMDVTVSFKVKPGPSLPGTGRRTLRLTSPAGESLRWTIDAADQGLVECPVLSLPAGVSQVELVCLDEPTSKQGRVHLVGVIEARLTPTGQ